MNHLLRRGAVYLALASMVPKMFTAYSAWFWMDMFVRLMAMLIASAFWQAVYAASPSLGGLTLQQTLTYAVLAQMLRPMTEAGVILDVGFRVREGVIANELVRPLDFQFANYVSALMWMVVSLVVALPLLLIGWLAFGLQLSSDPLVWLAFITTLVIGYSVRFFFDWIFASMAFYTTEVWGLFVLHQGISLFFSGVLLPLALMPGWLQAITAALPFAQAFAVPLNLLSGITPLTDVPGLVLTQVVWLIGMLALSRGFFLLAVRRITVQGG
jgi:ABC-2 type transport system permease protein